MPRPQTISLSPVTPSHETWVTECIIMEITVEGPPPFQVVGAGGRQSAQRWTGASASRAEASRARLRLSPEICRTMTSQG